MDALNVELRLVLGLLAASVALSAIWCVRHRALIAALPRRIVAGVGVLALLAAWIRLFATTPALVHGSLDHATALVESVIAFPSANMHRVNEYGYGSFATLGLLCAAFGRRVETIVAANAIISALCVFPLGLVAARWSGRSTAALYAAAAWAASPLVARLAHSEDAHVVATAFALCAIAWLEIAFASVSRLALVNAVIALALAVLSRQTLAPWIALCCAVVVERWWRSRSADRRLSTTAIIATLAIMCLPVLRFLALAQLDEGANQFVLMVFGIMASRPRAVLEILSAHPFFDVHNLSVLVPSVGLLGALSLCWRGSPVRLAFPASVFTITLVTLPFTLPVPGDRWAFRLPLYALGLIAVGAGAARIEERLVRRARFVVPVLTIAVALLAFCCRTALDNRRPSADLIEYQFVRDALEARPRPITLIGTGPTLAMAQRPGVRVMSMPGELSTLTAPWLFVDGRACHAYAPSQLLWPDRPGRAGNEAILRAWFEGKRIVHVGDRLSLLDAQTENVERSVEVPTQPMEPRCAGVLERLRQLPVSAGASWLDGPAVELEDQIPFFVYDRIAFRPRILESSPSQLGTAPEVEVPSGIARP